METTTEFTTKLSAIDKALAAAKARAAAKATSDGDSQPTAASKPVKEPKTKTNPDFAKAQRKQANDDLRAAAKAKRDAEREARRAAKATTVVENKGTHMKKVEKAGAKLPQLQATAQSLFNEVTTNLSRVDIATLALHLQHFNRVKATEMAAGRSYKQGQAVRITGGDPKFLGLQGTIESARPLRCFVNVPGVRKPVYLFTSDIEPMAEEPLAATGTEG